jgi:hypothetical protein
MGSERCRSELLGGAARAETFSLKLAAMAAATAIAAAALAVAAMFHGWPGLPLALEG